MFTEKFYQGDQINLCYEANNDDYPYNKDENGGQSFYLIDYGYNPYDTAVNSWWCGAGVKYDFCTVSDAGVCGDAIGASSGAGFA